MSDDPTNNETPAVPYMPEEMGDGARFDLSAVTPTDVPAPDAEPVPDHEASAELPPLSVLPGGKRRGRKDKPPKEAPPKGRPGALVRPLTDMYTSLGMMLAPFDPACSLAVIDNAKTCAESLDNLARQNDAVRRVILAMTETGAWGGVMIAHLPILLMVTYHHGPKDVSERIGPLAAMMNPNAFAAQPPAQGGPAA